MQSCDVFWLPLQAGDLCDPDIMKKTDASHRMFGRLSNCLEEQEYHKVTSWILRLMQPDMHKRMSVEKALGAEFLSAAQ